MMHPLRLLQILVKVFVIHLKIVTIVGNILEIVGNILDIVDNILGIRPDVPLEQGNCAGGGSVGSGIMQFRLVVSQVIEIFSEILQVKVNVAQILSEILSIGAYVLNIGSHIIILGIARTNEEPAGQHHTNYASKRDLHTFLLDPYQSWAVDCLLSISRKLSPIPSFLQIPTCFRLCEPQCRQKREANHSLFRLNACRPSDNASVILDEKQSRQFPFSEAGKRQSGFPPVELGVSSIKPGDGGGEIDRAEEVSGTLIVTYGNGAAMLEAGEKVLDRGPVLCPALCRLRGWVFDEILTG